MKRCFLLCTLMIGLYVRGQDGTIDRTFAYKGWRNVSYYSSNTYSEEAVRTFMQGDGKLLVVFSDGGGPRLARYNSNGSLDKSFADAGFSIRLENLYPIDAVKQSDGKIVVLCSWWNDTNNDFAVVRFNSDGSPDYSFGTNGMVIIDFFGDDDYPVCIAVQSDDRIVVAGEVRQPDADPHFGVARLNADGTPDTNFDSDGKTVTDLAPGSDQNADYPMAVAVHGGKIYVAGYTYDYNISEKEQVALVCYNSNGSLNTDFNSGGIVIAGMDYNAETSGLAVDDYGRVVVSVFQMWGTYVPEFFVMRYTASGQLDTDFGAGGIVTTTVGDEAKATAIAIRDGKILVAGNARVTAGAWDFAIARYNSDGTLDTGFDSDGVVITDLGYSSDDEAKSITLLPDNKFLVTGISYTGRSNDFAVVQFNNNGSFDGSLNGTGILTGYYPQPSAAGLNAIAIQSDGKILAAGDTYNANTQYPDLGITRYDVNGIIDTSFGVNGVTTIPFGSNVYEVVTMNVQSDGKIVVTARIAAADFALARLNSNGTLDATFGGGGTVTTDFEGYDEIYGATVQPDGKIIVVGYIHIDDFAVVRYTTSGTLDNTFGTGGKVTTDFFGDVDYSNAVAVQSDGKIIVGGYAFNNATNSNDFALARYTTAGKLDTKFGSGGKVTINFGGDDECSAIILQPDGKIIAAGSTEDASGYADFALVRLNANGTPDLTFDNDGKVTTDVGERDWPEDITLQSDGKIIVGSTVEDFSYNYYAAYVRYKNNGTVDSSFATNGRLVSGFTTQSFAVAWSNGRLYAGESSYDYPLQGFIAAYRAYGLPTVRINDAEVLYPTANAVLTISTKGTVTSPITVSYATQDGTAASKGKNPDYKSTRGTVVLTSTATSKTVSIPINVSAYAPGSSLKTFTVNLTMARQMNGIAEMEDATGVVTIIPQSTFAAGENMKVSREMVTNALTAKAFPNPSGSYFNLQLQSGSSTAVIVNVMDASGRVIERFNASANGTITLGSKYLSGIYYAEVKQGTEKVVLRLVKQ